MNRRLQNKEITLLIVARSARMLSVWAERQGLRVISADCFADLDTLAASARFFPLQSLNLQSVKTLTSKLATYAQPDYLIYGSGFERHPESLHFLQQHFTFLGNSAEVFSDALNKPLFFSKLAALQIDYPPVSFTAPVQLDGWLIKPSASEGGTGICYAVSENLKKEKAVYWQRLIKGEPLSALFVATRYAVQLIGFNQQIVCSNGNNPFQFAGVLSRPDLFDTLAPQLYPIIKSLTETYGLRGFNCIDFIYDQTRCHVLEINARPSASLQLYDQLRFEVLLDEPAGDQYDNKRFNAYQTLFADRQIAIKPGFLWPGWVIDRPASGSIIQQYEPICSIICSAKTYPSLTRLLQHRKQAIDILLYTGNYQHAISSKC